MSCSVICQHSDPYRSTGKTQLWYIDSFVSLLYCAELQITFRLLKVYRALFSLLHMSLVVPPGITSLSHMSVNSGDNTVAANSGSTLKSPAFKLSGPGALPFFKDLIALIISSLLGNILRKYPDLMVLLVCPLLPVEVAY